MCLGLYDVSRKLERGETPDLGDSLTVWDTRTGTLAIFGGVLLILIGIALAVLPIVPGFPVVAVGVLMLVAAHEPSRRLVNRGVSHLPRSAVTALRRVLVQGSGRASK
jgi:hypothetical protein